MRDLLDTNKCYLLDCGLEMFVWMGRNTSLDERRSASGAAEVLVVAFSFFFFFQLSLLHFDVHSQ